MRRNAKAKQAPVNLDQVKMEQAFKAAGLDSSTVVQRSQFKLRLSTAKVAVHKLFDIDPVFASEVENEGDRTSTLFILERLQQWLTVYRDHGAVIHSVK